MDLPVELSKSGPIDIQLGVMSASTQVVTRYFTSLVRGFESRIEGNSSRQHALCSMLPANTFP